MQTNLQLQDWWLQQFFASPISKDFYLTGGTALARFYFHHRESVDLDFFTNNQEIDLSSVSREINRLVVQGKFHLINHIATPSYLQYILEDQNGVQLKIDFVKDIPTHFGEISEKNGMRVDSLENIASNKITAILGRTEAKDFVDLYWILHETALRFDVLFALAKQKDLGLSEFYFANCLAQITALHTFPVMLKPFDQEKMRDYFLQLSEELLQRIKPQETNL